MGQEEMLNILQANFDYFVLKIQKSEKPITQEESIIICSEFHDKDSIAEFFEGKKLKFSTRKEGLEATKKFLEQILNSLEIKFFNKRKAKFGENGSPIAKRKKINQWMLYLC